MDFIYYVIPGAKFESWSPLEVFLLLTANEVMRSLVLVGGLAFAVSRFKWLRDKRIYRMPFFLGQVRSEFKWVIPTLIFDCVFFSALIKSGWVASDESNFLVTVAIEFVWLEIWFYFSHRAIHHPKLYFIHRQHHVAKVTGPLTSLSFSPAERASLLFGGFIPIALLSLAMPISYFGVAVYLVINTLLTLYIHLNVEIVPPWVHQIPVLNWLNPVSHHALHHARYNGNYGLFTPFLDRWLKTEYSDYKDVARLAHEGRGLTSLSQKAQRATESAPPNRPGHAA